MKTIGNILWFLLGGLEMALVWYLIGLLWCITIVGIPVGVQCFKIGTLCLWPFGKEIVYGEKTSSILLNILWIIFGGLELAVMHAILGVLFCITIIGIPFGKQYFKLARLSLMPFGATFAKKTNAAKNVQKSENKQD